MTTKWVLDEYRVARSQYDFAKQEQNRLRKLADEAGNEASMWSRRMTAWRQIYENLFDEPMPELENEDGDTA